jgi:5-methylcytosine-specific restriction endonuclease McrA
MKKRILTKEHKRKISEAHKKNGTIPPNTKGKVMVQEQKDKIRQSNLGKKVTEETKIKMANAKIGTVGYWKGKNRNTKTNKKISETLKQKNSKKPDFNKKCVVCESIITLKNKNLLDKKKFCSNVCKFESNKGENSYAWKGGKTEQSKLIRQSKEYKLWRSAVFARDNYTCIWCFSKIEIQADHIKPFAHYPELRFAIDNGRTLCRDCHRTTDTWGCKSLKNNKM